MAGRPRSVSRESRALEVPRASWLIRAAFALVATGLCLLMFGFGFRQEWATQLWVWDDARMSFIFLASIAAAVAAPAFWVAITGEFRAWAGVAINGVVVSTLASAYLLSRVVRDLTPEALPTALVFLSLTPLAAMSYRWARGEPVQNRRRSPRFVNGWFVVFIAILVITGTALILQVDRIFPWNLEPATSTLFGCFFLGASAYFVYAVRHAYWVIAAGALSSFLAYDVVLALPYLRMLVDDEESTGYGGMYGGYRSDGGDDVNETSLVLYLAVIGISACVALYAFLAHPDTRMVRRMPSPSTVIERLDEH